MAETVPANTIAQKKSLKAHNGWVTALATSTDPESKSFLSVSRDKTLVIWNVTDDQDNYAIARKRLKGHSHFVQDVALSTDGQFALTGAWDGTLRLWDLQNGVTARRFVGHTKDVLSVAFSPDNRQIVSGSRDKTINLWNTLGQCKYSIGANDENAHSDWVSCVRFSPNVESPVIVSAGWDKLVKVWDLQTCKLKCNLVGHTGYVNTVTVSPDGSLCASGGKDGTAILWDLQDGKRLSSLEAGETINALSFSPDKYWICAATGSAIKIWDLESKSCVGELVPEAAKAVQGKKVKANPVQCLSLAWSADGSTLYAGYSDSTIGVWSVHQAATAAAVAQP